MKVYQLTATDVDGEPSDWGFSPVFKTREGAERQRQNEILAYTTYNGEVLYECPYIFEITEIEVRE